MYKHKKIVLTGGPCAGKTTAMQRIVEEFTEKGYQVFVINEAATELILGGIKPFGEKACDMVEFQEYVLSLQLAKEKLFEEYANKCEQDTIILCDRGMMDGKAFVDSESFRQVLLKQGLTDIDVLSSYDAILHLVTAADGASEFYTTENNKARTETKEQAIERDRKCLESWLGHKNITIIGNESSFDEKIHNVILAIYKELGDPYPIQDQRKYLVKRVDLDKLKDNHLVKLELEQYFTDIRDGEDTMIRKVTKDGNNIYSRVTKKNTSVEHKRMTISRLINEADYHDAVTVLDKPIRKVRYCFTYNKQYYRLDIFDEPSNLMILEAEMTNDNKKLEIPDFIEVDKDITDDLNYRNVNLYKKINSATKKQLVIQKNNEK